MAGLLFESRSDCVVLLCDPLTQASAYLCVELASVYLRARSTIPQDDQLSMNVFRGKKRVSSTLAVLWNENTPTIVQQGLLLARRF